MATRSKAKLAAAAAAADTSTSAVNHATVKHEEAETTADGDLNGVVSNGKAKTTKPAPKRSKGKAEVAAPKSESCVCSQGDNGTPMVLCGECQIWYVFPD